MLIEIWSDIVCPFCYLGKKKLEKAIESLGLNGQVDIVWRSFQLDPDFPTGISVPSTQYLSDKKGYPLNQIQAIQLQLSDQAVEYGFDFNFDTALSFNTSLAHQLLHWSNHFGKSNELKEVLLKAYFTDGIDLSVSQNLAHLVTKVGLDEDEALLILSSEKYKDEVEADYYAASQIGVRGVPFFQINNQTVISGAQPDQVFEQVLQTEMIKSGIPSKTTIDGTCSIDGCD
jgi:predicted DsbA family dithiol-disulfide isomerase